MTAPNNWRPLPGVTRVPFGFPRGPYRPPPWWCMALLPALAIPVWGLMIFLFGWRKKK